MTEEEKKQSNRERHARWREQNREKYNTYAREYYKQNKERLKERAKQNQHGRAIEELKAQGYTITPPEGETEK